MLGVITESKTLNAKDNRPQKRQHFLILPYVDIQITRNISNDTALRPPSGQLQTLWRHLHVLAGHLCDSLDQGRGLCVSFYIRPSNHESIRRVLRSWWIGNGNSRVFGDTLFFEQTRLKESFIDDWVGCHNPIKQPLGCSPLKLWPGR